MRSEGEGEGEDVDEAEEFVQSFFDAATFEELLQSAPPSPPITPKPEPSEGRQICSVACILLALAILATLLLLPLLPGAPLAAKWLRSIGGWGQGDWVRGGWAGSEALTSISRTAPNGSAWLAGCPVGWSAAPGGQCLSSASHTGPLLPAHSAPSRLTFEQYSLTLTSMHCARAGASGLPRTLWRTTAARRSALQREVSHLTAMHIACAHTVCS